MNIALINEDSQADKNAIIFEALSDEAAAAGHEAQNYGMFSEHDEHEINFTQVGIMASVLLATGAADFVVTGCGTGQGACVSCNAFSNVVCGYVREPLDAYLFSQVNAGNAISMPFAQGFGWGGEVNLHYVFRSLFAQEFGGGYPQIYAEGEAKSRVRMLEHTKRPAQYAPLEAYKRMDQDVLRGLLNYPAFLEGFSRLAQEGEVTTYIKSLLDF